MSFFLQVFSLPFNVKRSGSSVGFFAHRFGLKLPKITSSVIWLHASSLGESRSMVALLKELTYQSSQHYLVSCQTKAAMDFLNQWVQDNQLKNQTTLIYCPLDAFWLWRRFFKVFHIQTLILVESELWPCLLKTCKRLNLNVLWVSGRMSHKNFKKRRWIKKHLNSLLGLDAISWFACQSKTDYERLLGLGINPFILEVVGNLKLDYWRHLSDQNPPQKKLSPFKEFNILVASCRDGEETMLYPYLFKAQQILKQQFIDLKVWFAPRHPDRFELSFKTIEQLHQQSFSNPPPLMRLSSCEISDFCQSGWGVIDTLGTLPEIYPHSHLVIVGGSFSNFGGHSVIEPASFSKPIVIGPFYQNVVSEVKGLKAQGCLWVLNDLDNLLKIIPELVDGERYYHTSSQCYQWVQSQAKICEKIIAKL